MKVITKAFGEIEVSEQQKITFEEGLLGFDDIHSFFLLDSPDGGPFYWLQSEDNKDIAFVIIDPNVMIDYEPDINPQELQVLEINSNEDVLLFCIVTIYDKAEDITVNLLGPIIINRKNKKGKQVICQNDKYSVKHPLIEGGK